MTRQRNDKHGTQFGDWLRKQSEIDSKLGYLATNIDYLWCNYKNELWMLIEEKRYLTLSKPWQQNLFKLIDKCCRTDPNYRGFHILRFEKTSPDDGAIYWDSQQISCNELIKKLQFDDSWVENI